MIRKLKARARADTFVNEPRKKRRYWDRTIYLLLVFVFFAAIGNYLVGERLLLRADSLDVLGRLADLSMQDAALAERQAALRSQYGIAQNQLPAAVERLSRYQERLSLLQEYSDRQVIPAARQETIEDQVYRARSDVAILEANLDGLSQEISAVETSRGHAREAITAMQTHYADGFHISGVQGIVGDRVPAPGEVFRPGEPIVTLLWGEPYVLVYLPETYLFDISEGDMVTVANGQKRHIGWIDAILPVSQSIPEEFRTAFRLNESKQLARVRLDADSPFPIQSPVEITRNLDAMAKVRQFASRIWPASTAKLGE